MPKQSSETGGELFIVDNREPDWSALRYLCEWCEIAKALDVATGYFDIGSLLAMDGRWQKIDAIRVLMGSEVNSSFAEVFNRVERELDSSLEREKRDNMLLDGGKAVVQALKDGKILCRVYGGKKFHAKCYITHGRLEVVGSQALVGSSNMTVAGLSRNIELNVKIEGPPVAVLREWYEERWNEAKDVTPGLLKVIERHMELHPPFDVYARSLHALFGWRSLSLDAWEKTASKIYPVLARYQRDGYHDLMAKANRRRGALLCDGVGLGKTFVGLMLIERLVEHERRRVALFAPKSALESVWRPELEKRLPALNGKFKTGSLECFSHTDLSRDACRQDMRDAVQRAEAVIIDEAHNFRNTGIKGEGWDSQSRYWRMADVCRGKKVFLLTATPVNNSLNDLRHLIELFTGGKEDYFRDLGFHSLRSHFRDMEKRQEKSSAKGQPGEPRLDGTPIGPDIANANYLFNSDRLLRELVVQRSRAYVKSEAGALFPGAKEPRVAPYSLGQTHGKLLAALEEAFQKDAPLFALPLYRPDDYLKKAKEKSDLEQGRQRQVVSLIRIQFLKRFESSIPAFANSCRRLLAKLLAWVEANSAAAADRKWLERWKKQHGDVIPKTAEIAAEDADPEEDVSEPELEDLPWRLDPAKYELDAMLDDIRLDMDELVKFISLAEPETEIRDDKCEQLLRLLRRPEVKGRKFLIFSEFKDTTCYLEGQLKAAGLAGVEELHSSSGKNRADVVKRFSPHYNGLDGKALATAGGREINILISTDVLSEGLNLQDCGLLINYDLHWNPVRLMQRIGRVDRRLNPEIETELIRERPEEAGCRGKVVYWNFLPPDELDRLLGLYRTVAKKTLRISRIFGIEGGKLLTPADDYETVRNFTALCEGEVTPLEKLRLEYEALLKDDPALLDRLDRLPAGLWSGKAKNPDREGGLFFCYALPGADAGVWSLENGETRWYWLADAAAEPVESAPDIAERIRSRPGDPRLGGKLPPAEVKAARKKIEAHIRNTYLKSLQAPVESQPALIAWMEVLP
ncbi:MAG: phospholipase D-like domain-containing protein [Planctomycetota bacterium]|jgi:superfamily II DNA or RNA helicase|nr:phospholipase D-like domain-containing protein [Planctomycetota bacterium]